VDLGDVVGTDAPTADLEGRVNERVDIAAGRIRLDGDLVDHPPITEVVGEEVDSGFGCRDPTEPISAGQSVSGSVEAVGCQQGGR